MIYHKGKHASTPKARERQKVERIQQLGRQVAELEEHKQTLEENIEYLGTKVKELELARGMLQTNLYIVSDRLAHAMCAMHNLKETKLSDMLMRPRMEWEGIWKKIT